MIKLGGKNVEMGGKDPLCGALWGVEENSILTTLHGGVGNIADVRQAGFSTWPWRVAKYT